MKRSGIQRKTPLASGSGPARKPMKRKAKRKPVSDKRWRSPDYLAWVRQQPCVLCGTIPCDAHHVIGLGWGLSGMGLTAPDSYVMPACRKHHGEIHADHTLHALQPHWIKKTIRAALADGVPTETRDELTHALAFIATREAQ